MKLIIEFETKEGFNYEAHDLARISLNMARVILNNRIYHFEGDSCNEDKIREAESKVRTAENNLNRLLRQS